MARVPGFKCILIAKKKDYIQNLADVGFQFERYVTGGSMMDTSNNTTVEHLHLMKIGEKTVLFRAEVDAVDTDGSPIEVKASNPRYWGTKVMFQMISSGSTKLCHGMKSRGVLTRVTLKQWMLSRKQMPALCRRTSSRAWMKSNPRSRMTKRTKCPSPEDHFVWYLQALASIQCFLLITL